MDNMEIFKDIFAKIEAVKAEKPTAGTGFRLMGLVADITEAAEALQIQRFSGLDCSESVDKKFAESDVLDALIVTADNERRHGDDILLVVVLDFLQTSELALAGLV